MKSKKNVLWLLLLGFLFPAWSQEGEIKIFPSPGEYRDDVMVSLSSDTGSPILYSFDSAGPPSLPYSVPLLLSALPGESREYRITASLVKEGVPVNSTTFRYIVDKSPPDHPRLNISSGTYEDTLNLYFTNVGEAQIVYSIGGSSSLPQTVWRGEPISLAGGSGNQIYHVSSYSVDSAGNKSRVVNNRYEIRSRLSVEPALTILSPGPGDYGNRQLLYLNSEGFRWVRYTINGGDPALTGQDYHSPLIIDRTGTVRVRVAGMTSDGGRIVSREVTFKVSEQTPPRGIPESGAYPTGVILRGNSPEALFCLEDRIPTEPDLPFMGEISVHPLPRGLRTVPLVVSQGGVVFRYFYIIDNRVPADPLIEIQDPLPLAASSRVIIRGSSFSRITYTLDGTAPDGDSKVFSGPFILNLPEDASAGSIIIKARAFGQNGKSSSEVSRLLTFKKERPDPPQVTITQASIADPALISYDVSPGLQVLYEISDTPGTIIPPVKTSSVLPNNAFLRVPEGMEKSFYLTFASMDSAGNLSDPTPVQEIILNRRNTTAPKINYYENLCRITGPAPLYFTIETVDRDGNTERSEPALYSQPFSLPGKEGEDISYRVTAWSEGENGRKSPSSTFGISRNLRIPQPPVILGLEDGREYLTGDFIFYLTPGHPEDLVFYSYSLGDQNPDPVGLESFKSDGTIRIAGKEGEKNLVNLRIRSYNRENNRFSSPLSYQFTLNQTDSLLPELQGYRQGELYNRAVTLSLPGSYAHNVFISFTTDGTPPGDPFGSSGKWLEKDITFSVGEGKAERILFLLGVEDSAGHRIIDKEVRWFGIDRSIPGLPALSGIPEGITWDDKVLITGPRTGVGGTLHYELSLDGSLPHEISSNSPVFPSSGLSIEGVPGENRLVVLRYRFRNNAGTWSDDEGVAHFMIDRRPVGLSQAPEMSILENRQQLILTWDIPPNRSLFFRFPDLNRDFMIFNEPVALPFLMETRSMPLEAYLVDDRGRKGETTRYNITVPGMEGSVFIKGVPDPPLANTEVRLYKGNSDDFLRYEVGVNGATVPEVNRFSPIFPKNLELAGAPGEILDYLIKIKRFADAESEWSQGEQTIEFSIDNSIPVPPRVEGISSHEHYQDDLIISFDSPGKVFYALQKGSREDNPGFPQFRLYNTPLAVTSQEGTFSTYRLYAYAVNEAGNQSEIKEWEFFIDREIIYLSSDGNDRNDGTRTKPFRTLDKALDYSRETGRKSIYLGAGEYQIPRSLSIESDLKIMGGFEISEWTKSDSGRTVIMRGDDYSSAEPLLLLQGRVELQGLRFSSSGTSRGPVLRGETRGLVMNDVEIFHTGGNGSPAVEIAGGEILIRNSLIEGSSFSGSSLISVKQGSLRADNSRFFRKGDNVDGSVITVSQAELKLSGVMVGLERGRSVHAIRGENSVVLIDNDSRIQPGSGTMESVGLSLTDSIVKVVDSQITETASSRLNRGIVMRGGQLLIQDSEIDLLGSLGVVLVQTSGTEYLILGSRFFAGPSQEYSYLLRMSYGDGRVVNNLFRQEASRDSTAFLLTEGRSRIFNNTLITRGGSQRTEGIRATGDLEHVNNIMIKEGVSNGTAVVFEGRDLVFSSNCFNTWPSILREGGQTYATVDRVNQSDGSPSGGARTGNIQEEPSKTFRDPSARIPRLSADSSCINSGITLINVKEAATDLFKNRRPNPVTGNRALFDIGAEEYTP